MSSYRIVHDDGSSSIEVEVEGVSVVVDDPMGHGIVIAMMTLSGMSPGLHKMSYKTKPSYSAPDQLTISSDVPDSEDGAIAYAESEGTAWQLSLSSSTTIGAGVIATRSGVGRWLRIQVGSPAITADDNIFGTPVDGDRTESGGGSASALTQTRCYGNLTLSNSTALSMAGYRLMVYGALTIGAGSALHNDGSPAAANVFGAAAPSGELAVLGLAGRVGGDPTGNGAACYTDPRVVGGNAGAGGAGASTTGGTAAPQSISTATYGTQWSVLALEYLCSLKALNLTQYVGGVGGAGGGGGNAGFKYGGAGGGGGGLAWIRAKKIVNNGRISCRGGAGGLPTSGGNGGGGGGGGGGVLVIWCDEWTGSPPDCNGGASGLGDGTGSNGSAGSDGKVLVYRKGELVFRSGFGVNAPDINIL